MAYWTTEQVAEHLGITAQDVYESRRRKAFPGVLGVRKGRKLLFPVEQIQNPPEPETTTDVNEAVLWALNGIHTTLRAIHNELRKKELHDLTEAQWNIFVRDNLADDGEEE